MRRPAIRPRGELSRLGAASTQWLAPSAEELNAAVREATWVSERPCGWMTRAVNVGR
ncbi:hypothetical protein ACFFX0_07290 [Citricoccus parietis]|uniref:Uncharacterized protein n=1 Tax=Citricoccus parietis TaxID=592307 RepID=A0ABV5FWF7_9MICC